MFSLLMISLLFTLILTRQIELNCGVILFVPRTHLIPSNLCLVLLNRVIVKVNETDELKKKKSIDCELMSLSFF